jgi:hypothetical protein
MYLLKKILIILIIVNFILGNNLSIFEFAELTNSSQLAQQPNQEILNISDNNQDIEYKVLDPAKNIEQNSITSTRYYAFSVTSSDKSALENSYFEVMYTDKSVGQRLQLELDQEMIDESQFLKEKFVSRLYTYSEGIQAVNLISNNLELLNIQYYNFENNNINNSYSGNYVGPLDEYDEIGEGLFLKKMFNAIGINLITRSEWGVRKISPIYENPYFPINKIVVHHTATGVDVDPKVTVRAIHEFHAVTREWTDIGYNYLIDPAGRIYQGRHGANGIRGNHAIPNSGTIGIALLGNFENEVPTIQAQNSLAKLIGLLSQFNEIVPVYGSTVIEHNLHSHQNGQPYTACAGKHLNLLLPGIVSNSINYINSNENLNNSIIKYNEILQTQHHHKFDSSFGYLYFYYDGISNTELNYLQKDNIRGLESVFVADNYIAYKIEYSLHKSVMLSLMLAYPDNRIDITGAYETHKN